MKAILVDVYIGAEPKVVTKLMRGVVCLCITQIPLNFTKSDITDDFGCGADCGGKVEFLELLPLVGPMEGRGRLVYEEHVARADRDAER